MNNNKYLSRNLRKNQTPQETKMWNILRRHGFYNLKFKRQYPIGNYIVDFVCIEKMVIIEIDGGQHNENMNIEADNIRTKYLTERGFKVIRFWNNDVDENFDGVYEELKRFMGF